MPSIKSAALLIATTTILLGGLTSKTTFAASTQDKDDKHATLEEGKLRLYEKKVDSLLLERAKSQALDTTNLAIDLLDNEEMVKSDIPDSVFIKRLSSIPSLIDLPYNNVVRASILWYVIRKKNVSEKILGLTGYYFPIIEQTLDKHDLPLELRYLPIIESALNPVAVSRVGATGLWQFMYGTGKQYKLNITSFVDERRDPLAASEAAAKFLNFMLSDTEATKILGMTRGIPSNKKALKVLEQENMITGISKEVLDKALAYQGKMISPYYEDERLVKIFAGYVQKLDYGQIDTDKAAEGIIADMEAALKNILR